MPLRRAALRLALLGALAACASGHGTSATRSAGGASWRRAVVQSAESMLGVPYRRGGASPAGFDCSGLVVYSYARAGLGELPRTAQGLEAHSHRVARDELLPGDLLFFAFGGRRTQHVAIYVGEGQFVHAPKTGGSVERVSLAHPYWRREPFRAGRPVR